MYNDNNNSHSDGEYFTDDMIRRASFRVAMLKSKYVSNILLIVVPVLIFMFTALIMEVFRYLGYMLFVVVYYVLVFGAIGIGILLFINNAGRQMKVTGKEIVFRRFFIFQETISVDEVEKVEVMTDLVLHTRYHHERFNKAVICYGNGNKISFSDNLYSGWSELIGYMELNEKTVYKNGPETVQKQVDDMFGK